MFLVGLTGSIATGKSTVSRMLADRGCPVIDADIIAREVVKPGEPAWHDIRQSFGPNVFQPDGVLDRQALGHIVFGDIAKRQRLNEITHPRIYRRIFWRLLQLFFSGEQFVVLDMPLLLERNTMTWLMSEIVVVSCREQQQMERLMLRNNLTESEVHQRIGVQMPIGEKVKLATFVIDNSGSMAVTASQAQRLVEHLRRRKAHWRVRAIVLLTATAIVGGVTATLRLLIWPRS